MKIGVVSDTHSHPLPGQLINAFKSVDLIIHAGDFCSMEDLKAFKKIKTVRAVFGNMDGLELRQVLPERDVFDVGGLKVGLYHGQGAPQQVLDFVRREFKKDKPDIVIFGHSHMPMNETIGDILYFNPGSPTDTVRAPFRSYGILEIDHGKVAGQIIKVDQ